LYAFKIKRKKIQNALLHCTRPIRRRQHRHMVIKAATKDADAKAGEDDDADADAKAGEDDEDHNSPSQNLPSVDVLGNERAAAYSGPVQRRKADALDKDLSIDGSQKLQPKSRQLPKTHFRAKALHLALAQKSVRCSEWFISCETPFEESKQHQPYYNARDKRSGRQQAAGSRSNSNSSRGIALKDNCFHSCRGKQPLRSPEAQTCFLLTLYSKTCIIRIPTTETAITANSVSLPMRSSRPHRLRRKVQHQSSNNNSRSSRMKQNRCQCRSRVHRPNSPPATTTTTPHQPEAESASSCQRLREVSRTKKARWPPRSRITCCLRARAKNTPCLKAMRQRSTRTFIPSFSMKTRRQR
jgi:hypothetical protein